MIEAEAKAIAEGGMTEKEFAMAREQLKSGYILGLESTSARMQSNGRRLLLMDATRTESETIDRINAVSCDAANTLMRQMLTAPHSVALVGKGVADIAQRLA
jgi:predicted Zn-dependent peptidase